MRARVAGSHPRLSATLVVVGGLLLALALPLGYLDRNAFTARGFADNAAATLDDQAVRTRIADELTQALVARDPRLVAAVPLLRSISGGLLETSQARALVRRAALDTHNAVFSQTEGSIVVNLADLGVIVLNAVSTRQPELAGQLAQPKRIVVDVSDRSFAAGLARFAERVRFLAIILPLLALALFALALVADRERRRAALRVGIAGFVAAALNFAALIVVRALVLAGHQGESRDVLAGIFDAFLGSFELWCGVVALAGAITAASAASVIGEIDPARVPALLWARVTRPPAGALQAVLGAVALILAGVLIISDPAGALQLAAGILGAWLIFAGAVTLLRLLVGPEPQAGDTGSIGALRRDLIPWLAGGAALVAVAAVGVGLAVDNRSGAQPLVNDNPGCNGHVELCGRRYDTVTAPTAHNAMSSAQALFTNANQGLDIENQLDLGIRGLLIDAYEGQRNKDGVVRTDLPPKVVDPVEAQIGPDGLAAVQRLAGSVAFGPVDGAKQLYLCHVVCELGALDALPALRGIKDWMDRNPREVLTIVVEDAAPTAEIVRAFEESGLADLANDGPLGPGGSSPTLEQMIDSGKRLVVMAEKKGNPSGWYRRAYEVTQETPYSFADVQELRSNSSCRANRGGTTPPLLLLNNWVESYPPNPKNADIVNQRDFLVSRARECERIRSRTVNLLAVDFAERGDVVGAADVLNGVAASATTGGSPAPAAP